jgi:trimethylamine:corrinoid methyltransferase-like protein
VLENYQAPALDEAVNKELLAYMEKRTKELI